MEGGVVVVTGGGTGLGLEISRGFAALGANVIVPSRSPENQAAFLEEARTHGWRPMAISSTSVSPPRSAASPSGSRRARPADVLVNNAAGNFGTPPSA